MTLKASLLDSDRRDGVVDDLVELVDQEVGDKGGVSGAVVKTGYAAVKKIKPGIIRSAIDSMLDEFVDALEPFWAEFQAQSAGDFGAFLAARPEQASEALLAVTDRRAERTSREAVKSVYSKLRSNAQQNVIEALPRLGRVIESRATAA
ncbi:DUF6918 family protein [Pseudonocardia sp. H11422]|uniref:DUF6918 family protein n=1 Tax=Pseudonocardia sp. H11422 TaxID=2835866 RepID=UPI0027E2D85C|nr:hypothetical protein [Pseudonocardia sp. H11422]